MGVGRALGGANDPRGVYEHFAHQAGRSLTTFLFDRFWTRAGLSRAELGRESEPGRRAQIRYCLVFITVCYFSCFFYTFRVFERYTGEGMALLAEGNSAEGCI